MWLQKFKITFVACICSSHNIYIGHHWLQISSGKLIYLGWLQGKKNILKLFYNVAVNHCFFIQHPFAGYWFQAIPSLRC